MHTLNCHQPVYQIVSLDGKVHSTHTTIKEAREALRQLQPLPDQDIKK